VPDPEGRKPGTLRRRAVETTIREQPYRPTRKSLIGGRVSAGESPQAANGSAALPWGRMRDAPATFLFADIAGFTALTEAHGDQQAVALVDAFCAAVDVELPAGGTRVKSIGDAVMLRVSDPGDAILLGLRMTRDVLRENGMFGVRVGLHHGTAVEREGDYFGATVNLAARVSSLAAGGEVLMTGQTAVLVPDLDGVVFESRGKHDLRNVAEPVEIFAALRASDVGADELPIDPVCQMAVDPDRAAGRLTHEGTVYYFCSLPCAGHFASYPERFARATH